MFSKNTDEVKVLKQKLKDKELEIENLQHEHKVEMAREQCRHETDMLAHKATINSLEDKYGVLENLQASHADLKRRELVLETEKLEHNANIERLAKERKEFEAEYDTAMDKLDKREGKLDEREEALEDAEGDKRSGSYLRGKNDGYVEGFTAALARSNNTEDRSHKLLTLHALAATQAPIVHVAGEEQEEPESSKILADAFAKHLTKTVDKLLDDEDEAEE